MSNILISPTNGKITFDSNSAGVSTQAALSASSQIVYNGMGGVGITSYNTSGTDRFTVDGTNGRLLTVSDTSSGSIFSVNDISGLPIIDVNTGSTDVIKIGTYGTNAFVVNGTNIGIGAASPTQALTIKQDGRILFMPNSTWSRSLSLGGNGYGGNSTTASIATTNGSLHLDAATASATYLNHYGGTGGVAFGTGTSTVVAWMGPDGDLWKGSADNTGSQYWHAGNDGATSGLDADLLDGQHGSYYLPVNTTANWPTVGNGQTASHLGWKNYGVNHVIIDASAGTAPNGAAIDRYTAQFGVDNPTGINSWGYSPCLMGWNGSNTYGLRVEFANNAYKLNGNLDSAYVHLAGTETISGAKTFSGNVYAPNVTSGTNNTQVANTAFVASADIDVKVGHISQLGHGGFIQSDGATSNRAQIYGPFDATNNPREWIAGAASLTIAAVVTVPTSNPSTQINLVAYSSSTANAVPFGLRVLINTSSSALYVVQTAASAGVDERAFFFTNFRSTYSGQTIFLKITLTQGTATNPVVEVNGVNISSSFTLTTGGTAPAWLDAAMVPTYRLVGYNWPSGPAPIVTPILGTTSAADDAFYMSTGKWPAWVVRGASNVAYKSNTFNNESSGWANINTATITNNIGYVTFGGLSSSSISARVQALSSLNANIPVVVSFEYRKTGGSGRIAFSIGVYPSVDTANDGLNNWSEVADTSGSFVSRSFTLQNTTGGTYVVFFGGAATYDVRNFSLKDQGALSLPAIQPISVVDDVSGIGGNQGRILGGTPVTDKTNWRISSNTWLSSNQRILDGSIVDSTKDVIDNIEQSTSGTPTTTIGSVSAGTQYKASSALTAGINPVTLVTRKLASNEVWVNSSSTAVVRTTITGHRTT